MIAGTLKLVNIKKVLIISAITGLFAGLFISINPVKAQSGARDCDSNAVIRCGALTFNELGNRIDNNSGARKLFSAFGISRNDLDKLSADAVNGTVTRSGNVIVNGRIVATNAISAGRQFIPGSTRISVGGMTFFRRPTSVSFASSSLDAFVVMRNGSFKFAILKSCGNPVIATPKRVTTKVVTRTKVVKRVICKCNVCRQCAQNQPQTQTQTQSQNQSQSVVINSTVPTQAQTSTAAPETAPSVTSKGEVPTTVPNTGPENLLGLFLGSSAIGTGIYQFFIRKKL